MSIVLIILTVLSLLIALYELVINKSLLSVAVLLLSIVMLSFVLK